MSLPTGFKAISQAALGAVLLLAAPLWGQEFRGTITGTVVDSAGALVAQAQIEARNVDTAAAATARSNEAGLYAIPFLLPGTYTVTASAKGFKQAVRERVELHSGDKVQTDLRLEVGPTSESVTVTAESERTVTTSSSGT